MVPDGSGWIKFFVKGVLPLRTFRMVSGWCPDGIRMVSGWSIFFFFFFFWIKEYKQNPDGVRMVRMVAIHLI